MVNAYEFSRLLPATWKYCESDFTFLLVLVVVAAAVPLLLAMCWKPRPFAVRPSAGARSLPATPVKPRLA